MFDTIKKYVTKERIMYGCVIGVLVYSLVNVNKNLNMRVVEYKHCRYCDSIDILGSICFNCHTNYCKPTTSYSVKFS